MRSCPPTASRKAASTGIAGVVTTPSAPFGSPTSSNESVSSCSISAGTPAASCTVGRGTGLVVEHAGIVRRRVHVLAEDQTVLEGEHVDPVPLDPLSRAVRRRPLADDEAVADVQAAPGEPEIGTALEDPGDVRPDGVALDAIARRVVLE